MLSFEGSRSPTAVIENIELALNSLKEQDKVLLPLVEENSPAKKHCIHLPPLREVTVDQEHSDSVSSVSSFGSIDADDESDDNEPRSIFASYWKKHGREEICRPVRMQPNAHTCPAHLYCRFPGVLDDLKDDATCGVNTYESALKRYEDNIPTTVERRRNITGYHGRFAMSMSAPSLFTSIAVAQGVFPCRKTQSTSAIDRESKRIITCLRQCRYSGKNRRNPEVSRQGKSSVRFNHQVSVVQFVSPDDKWVADGWSDMFV